MKRKERKVKTLKWFKGANLNFLKHNSYIEKGAIEKKGAITIDKREHREKGDTKLLPSILWHKSEQLIDY